MAYSQNIIGAGRSGSTGVDLEDLQKVKIRQVNYINRKTWLAF